MKDQAPGETVAPKVNWESSARSYTDVGIGAVFGAGLCKHDKTRGRVDNLEHKLRGGRLCVEKVEQA